MFTMQKVLLWSVMILWWFSCPALYHNHKIETGQWCPGERNLLPWNCSDDNKSRSSLHCTLLTNPATARRLKPGAARAGPASYPLPHRYTLYLTVWNRSQGSFSWGSLQKIGHWWWEPRKDTASPQTCFGVLCACCRMEPELHLCIFTEKSSASLAEESGCQIPWYLKS